MIFSIQRYLEDYFHRCGFTDIDQYAVSLAALYDRQRHRVSMQRFISIMGRMRTTFYKSNKYISRVPFEKKLLALLDSKFKKKDFSSSVKRSPRELRHQVGV